MEQARHTMNIDYMWIYDYHGSSSSHAFKIPPWWTIIRRPDQYSPPHIQKAGGLEMARLKIEKKLLLYQKNIFHRSGWFTATAANNDKNDLWAMHEKEKEKEKRR